VVIHVGTCGDIVKRNGFCLGRREYQQPVIKVSIRFRRDRMQYDKDLIEDLREIAILYHASSLLSYKLQEVLDRHIPHLGETCMERGCVDYTLA
jgi:hypothetical protein